MGHGKALGGRKCRQRNHESSIMKGTKQFSFWKKPHSEEIGPETMT